MAAQLQQPRREGGRGGRAAAARWVGGRAEGTDTVPRPVLFAGSSRP